MIKPVKWIVGLFIITSLMTLGLFIAASQFLKPNNLKPIISQALSEKLGHPIELNGDLKFTLTPNVSLSTGSVTVLNREGFKHPMLASVENIELHMQLKPLLKKRIIIDALTIKGAKVFLETNANQQANWIVDKKKNDEYSRRLETSSSYVKRDNLDLSIGKILVSHSQIEYLDTPNNQMLKIDNAQLTAKQLDSQLAFPLDLSFDFSQIENNKTALVAKAKVIGNLKFNKLSDLQINNADITTKILLSNTKPIDTNIKSTVIANFLKNKIVFKDSAITVNQSLAKGHIDLQLAKKIDLNFDLKMDELDTRKFVTTYSHPLSIINPAFAASNTLALNAFHEKINLKGKLNIKQILINNLKLANVAVNVQSERKGINFKSIVAELYQGFINGQAYLDLQQATPNYQILGRLDKVNLEPLLGSFIAQAPLSGISNAQFDLRTQGLTQDQIINHLNGNIKFSVSEGTINGIDLPYYYYKAQSLIKSDENAQTENRNLTPFNSLSASFNANKGVLENNDLMLTAPRFRMTGQGKINLPLNQLNYQISAKRLTETGEDKDKIPAILKISGPFNDLSVLPDLEAMAKPAIKEELDKQINKQINKIFKNDKESPNESDQSPNVEDKLNKEIEKGLKKLFKF